MERVEFFVLSSSELDDLVKQKYPQFSDFDFIYDTESSNDACHWFSVEENDWDSFDVEDWKEALENPIAYPLGTHLIIRRLCKDGFLPYGEILVYVCW